MKPRRRDVQLLDEVDEDWHRLPKSDRKPPASLNKKRVPVPNALRGVVVDESRVWVAKDDWDVRVSP